MEPRTAREDKLPQWAQGVLMSLRTEVLYQQGEVARVRQWLQAVAEGKVSAADALRLCDEHQAAVEYLSYTPEE